MGHTPVLNTEEENKILDVMIENAKKGIPFTYEELIKTIRDIVQLNNIKTPFKNGVPGPKWFMLFSKRNKKRFTEYENLIAEFHNVEADPLIMLSRKVKRKQQDNENGGRKKRGPKAKAVSEKGGVSDSTSKESSSAPEENDKVTEPCDYVASSPASDSSYLDKKNTREDESDDISGCFRPGQRLEVMDFNEKWYPVRVLEVDYEGAGEVLVHYEKWSNRYDEWVRMDSNRIRRPKLPSITSRTNFKVGEKVMATWSYSLKFPAIVKAVLPNDKYDVLFYDGYQKTQRGCKITKATEEDLKNMTAPRKEKKAPPIGSDPVPKDLGTKEERRQMKRKFPNVLEILHTGKKRKVEKKPPPPPPPPVPVPPPPKQRVRRRQRMKRVFKRVKKEETVSTNEDKEVTKEEEKDKPVEETENETVTDTVNTEVPHESPLPQEESAQQVQPQEEKVVIKDDEDSKSDDHKLVIDEGAVVKKKRRRRRTNKEQGTINMKSYVYTPRRKAGSEDDTDRWDAEIPEGAAPVKFDSPDGILRESIIVPDKKLPTGWTKHTMLRRNSAKWDVFLVKPNVSTPSSSTKIPKRPPSEASIEVKRIKTLLPKTKIEPDPKPASVPVHETTEVVLSTVQVSTPVQVSGVQPSPVGSEGFTCPREGCGKYFRKENLLQMHVKHYHPEYSKIMGSTPNVADLAYARTVGEPLEDSRGEVTACGTFLDRINKFEAERKARAENNLSKVGSSSKKHSKQSNQLVSVVKTDKIEADTTVESMKTESEADKSSTVKPEAPALTSSGVQPTVQENDSQQLVVQREEPLVEPSNSLSESNHSSVPHLIAALTKPLQINNREDKQSTIKTILPVRLPSSSSESSDKLRSGDDAKEEESGLQTTPFKTVRIRKRDADHVAKRIKLGSEDCNQEEEKQEVSKGATSYRFAQNKTGIPLVSLEKLTVTTDSNGRVLLPPQELDGFKDETVNDVNEESSVDAVPASEQTEEVYEQLKKEEIINCICGFREEDGLMIQCDLCLCWQHGLCNNITKESEVPEKYVCYICQNPSRQRNSNKYSHNQEWIIEGKLPSLSFRQKNEQAIAQRESMLKKSHNLTASLLQLQGLIHSLRVKAHIAQKPSHPKLYLWSKSWSKEEKLAKSKGDKVNEESKSDADGQVRIPEPEAAIDEEECRLRLLEHIEDYQQQIDDRLACLEAQIAALEAEDPDLANDETPDYYPHTKQTIQMILRDLQTVNRVALLS